MISGAWNHLTTREIILKYNFGIAVEGIGNIEARDHFLKKLSVTKGGFSERTLSFYL